MSFTSLSIKTYNGTICLYESTFTNIYFGLKTGGRPIGCTENGASAIFLMLIYKQIYNIVDYTID